MTPAPRPWWRPARPWFVLLLLATVLVQGATYLCRPVVSYQVMAVGGGGLQIGLVTASFAVLPLLVVLPMGRWADRGRVGPLITGGAALIVAACLILGSSETMAGVLLGNGLFGLGQLASVIGLQSLIAMLSADSKHDRDFGLFTAAVSMGHLLGPAIGGAVLGAEAGGVSLALTQRAFLVGAAIAALAVAVSAELARRARPITAKARASTQEAHGGSQEPGTAPRAGLLAGILTSVAVLTTVDIVTSYLPLLGEQRGVAPATVGALLSLRAAMSFLSRLAIPVLMRHVRRFTAIAASSSLAAGTLLVIALADTTWMLAASVAVAGLLLGLGQPLSMTWVVRAVPPHQRSSALAHRLTGNRLGQVLVPVAAGALTESVGVAGPFLMTGGFLGVSVAFLFTARDGRGRTT